METETRTLTIFQQRLRRAIHAQDEILVDKAAWEDVHDNSKAIGDPVLDAWNAVVHDTLLHMSSVWEQEAIAADAERAGEEAIERQHESAQCLVNTLTSFTRIFSTNPPISIDALLETLKRTFANRACTVQTLDALLQHSLISAAFESNSTCALFATVSASNTPLFLHMLLRFTYAPVSLTRAICLAAEKDDNHDIVRILIAHNSATETKICGYAFSSALHVAACRGALKIVRTLLDVKDSRIWLNQARVVSVVQEGDIAAVRMILQDSRVAVNEELCMAAFDMNSDAMVELLQEISQNKGFSYLCYSTALRNIRMHTHNDSTAVRFLKQRALNDRSTMARPDFMQIALHPSRKDMLIWILKQEFAVDFVFTNGVLLQAITAARIDIIDLVLSDPRFLPHLRPSALDLAFTTPLASSNTRDSIITRLVADLRIVPVIKSSTFYKAPEHWRAGNRIFAQDILPRHAFEHTSTSELPCTLPIQQARKDVVRKQRIGKLGKANKQAATQRLLNFAAHLEVM